MHQKTNCKSVNDWRVIEPLIKIEEETEFLARLSISLVGSFFIRFYLFYLELFCVIRLPTLDWKKFKATERRAQLFTVKIQLVAKIETKVPAFYCLNYGNQMSVLKVCVKIDQTNQMIFGAKIQTIFFLVHFLVNSVIIFGVKIQISDHFKCVCYIDLFLARKFKISVFF